MQNNRVTEIGMFVLAGLLIIGGVVLIYFGKITFVEFSPFLVSILGMFGINIAYKAPSPAQQQQITSLQAVAHVHAEPAPVPHTSIVPPAPQPAPQQFVTYDTRTATAPQTVSGFTSLELPAMPPQPPKG